MKIFLTKIANIYIYIKSKYIKKTLYIINFTLFLQICNIFLKTELMLNRILVRFTETLYKL